MRSDASRQVSNADIGLSPQPADMLIGDDFTMYLWDPTNHGTKPVSRLLGHQNKVNHVQFSPDGTTIASAGWDNHTKLWNARDGKFMKSLRGHVAPVYQCAWSADSRLLVTGSKDCTLKVWNVRTGNMAMDLPGHEDEVSHHVCFQPIPCH